MPVREYPMSRLPSASSPAVVLPIDQGGTVSEGFERECVSFFADVVGVLGVPRSLGQIYGLLFASPRPLSFTDIVGKLDISRGSASQGLKALRELGAIRSADSRNGRAEAEMEEVGDRSSEFGGRRSEVQAGANSELRTAISARDGNRRELFEPELGLRNLVGGVLRTKVDPLVRDGVTRLKALRVQAQGAPDMSGRKFALDRVKQIEGWRRQLGLLLPLLKTILGPKRSA